MTSRQKHAVKMVGGITLAALAAAATTFGAVQKFVFTRQEGELVERRMETIEKNYREDVKEIRLRIEQILSELRHP